MPNSQHGGYGRKIVLSAILVAGVLLAAGFYLFELQASILEISAFSSGEIRWCAPMAQGEEFTLSFIHSVNKRPVFDTLQARGDHILIVRSRYDAFGAGMPEATTGEGTFKVLEDGWLEWTVNRPVPEITVRVGRVARHTLTVRARDVLLADLAEPGSALTLRVRKTYPLCIFKGRCSCD